MPSSKLNPRQESFARHIAQGCSGREAYQQAGYAVSDLVADANASRLLGNARVGERIAELQAQHAARAEVTVDSLVAELDDMLQLATRQKLPAAGVAAILGKARLLGLVVDKTEIATVIRKPARSPTSDTQVSLEEWQAKFAPKRAN